MNKDVELYMSELKKKLENAIAQNNQSQANTYRMKIKTANKIIHLYEHGTKSKLIDTPSNDFCW